MYQQKAHTNEDDCRDETMSQSRKVGHSWPRTNSNPSVYEFLIHIDLTI